MGVAVNALPSPPRALHAEFLAGLKWEKHAAADGEGDLLLLFGLAGWLIGHPHAIHKAYPLRHCGQSLKPASGRLELAFKVP